MKFVQAKNYSKANRTAGQITGVVIHTMEAPEGAATAENVASWFAGASAPQASAHYNVDTDSVVQSVREEDVAWHAGPANGWTVGIEHAGYAKQTPEEWADASSVAILERSADLVAGIVRRWGIPIVRLTADDLKMGRRAGIFGHVDVTRGLSNGVGHTDPGEHFPWEEYIALVKAKVAALEAAEIDADTEPPPAVPAPTGPDVDGFVEVELNGEVWLVEPYPTAFVTIEEAMKLAASSGCVLPTPALSDAIWRAADFRVDPSEIIQVTDGVHMNTPELRSKVTGAIERLLAGRVLGVDYRLFGGAFKDVVDVGGKPCLYGWHAASQAFFDQRLKARLGFTMKLHPPETPGEGLVVQPVYGGHALTHGDYSQSARRCRRKA